MIKRLIPILAFSILSLRPAAPARFEQVSDHVYFLQSGSGGHSVGAVVTKEGVVLIDPPQEAELSATMEALKRLTSSPVRWVICTSYRRVEQETLSNFHRLGAAFISHKSLDTLALKAESIAPEEPWTVSQWLKGPRRETLPTPRFNFGRQMRLFPDNIEVRILALEHQAHTGGDIVVLVPDEKVLLVGDLYRPGRFPDIDSEPGEGSAEGWINGIRQVMRWVPLLKSAKPEPKPDPEEAEQEEGEEEEEKTLEELVTVVPGRGPISNLQEVKDLYDLARGIRTAAGRAIKAGRSLRRFLAQGSLGEHRQMDNFENYATEIYNALANK